jgi:tetratricopeptide (TPR) repeat protein
MPRRNRPPAHLPATVRDHVAVIAACRERDLGRLFRIVNNLTEYPEKFTASHIARRCEMTQSQVGDYMADQRRASSLTIFNRVADGLHIPATRFGLAPRPWEHTVQASDRAPALQADPNAHTSPATDTAQFVRKATAATIDQKKEMATKGDPDAGEFDEMKRRELLRALSVAGALVALPPEHVDDSRHSAVIDGTSVEESAQLNAHLWRIYSLASSKRAIYPLVRDQLSRLTSSLRQTRSEATHRKLCALASDLLQLAGEAFFDANRYSEAAHCYMLAASASKEVDAFDLWACAMTRHSFITLYEHSFAETAPLLDAASRLAQRGDSQLSTRFWVAAVQAETFAGLGDLDACNRALDAAEAVHELRGQVHNGGWLRFDGSRLPEQRGACYTRLGRYDLAEEALTDALTQQLSPRRRGSVLSDLALLGIQRGDIDQTLSYSNAAVELAQQTSSGWIERKLRAVQAELGPLTAHPRIGELNESINTLNVTL